MTDIHAMELLSALQKVEERGALPCCTAAKSMRAGIATS